jgi:hypothetical protein
MSDGDGLSKDVVDTLLKNRFEIPTSTPKTQHHSNNWFFLLSICFGGKSLLAKEAKKLVTHIDTYEALYDACFRCDKDF